MDAAKNAGNAVVDSADSALKFASNKANETLSGASYESNKSIAKNSHAPVGDRFTAAGDALSDKVDQKSHGASAEVDKQNI